MCVNVGGVGVKLEQVVIPADWLTVNGTKDITSFFKKSAATQNTSGKRSLDNEVHLWRKGRFSSLFSQLKTFGDF